MSIWAEICIYVTVALVIWILAVSIETATEFFGVTAVLAAAWGLWSHNPYWLGLAGILALLAIVAAIRESTAAVKKPEATVHPHNPHNDY